MDKASSQRVNLNMSKNMSIEQPLVIVVEEKTHTHNLTHTQFHTHAHTHTHARTHTHTEPPLWT